MSTIVSQPSTQIVYAARRSNLRLTKQRRFPQRNPITGEVEGMTPGQYVGFREGVFAAAASGTVRLVDTLDGGVAEIDAKDLHEWLGKHRLNGDLQEGFWKVEQAAPVPTAEENDAINEATFNLDIETLNRMLEAELAGWKRPDFIQNIEKGVGRVEQMQAEIERRAAEEKTETPKPKAK